MDVIIINIIIKITVIISIIIVIVYTLASTAGFCASIRVRTHPKFCGSPSATLHGWGAIPEKPPWQKTHQKCSLFLVIANLIALFKIILSYKEKCQGDFHLQKSLFFTFQRSEIVLFVWIIFYSSVGFSFILPFLHLTFLKVINFQLWLIKSSCESNIMSDTSKEVKYISSVTSGR